MLAVRDPLSQGTTIHPDGSHLLGWRAEWGVAEIMKGIPRGLLRIDWDSVEDDVQWADREGMGSVEVLWDGDLPDPVCHNFFGRNDPKVNDLKFGRVRIVRDWWTAGTWQPRGPGQQVRGLPVLVDPDRFALADTRELVVPVADSSTKMVRLHRLAADTLEVLGPLEAFDARRWTRTSDLNPGLFLSQNRLWVSVSDQPAFLVPSDPDAETLWRTSEHVVVCGKGPRLRIPVPDGYDPAVEGYPLGEVADATAVQRQHLAWFHLEHLFDYQIFDQLVAVDPDAFLPYADALCGWPLVRQCYGAFLTRTWTKLGRGASDAAVNELADRVAEELRLPVEEGPASRVAEAGIRLIAGSETAVAGAALAGLVARSTPAPSLPRSRSSSKSSSPTPSCAVTRLTPCRGERVRWGSLCAGQKGAASSAPLT